MHEQVMSSLLNLNLTQSQMMALQERIGTDQFLKQNIRQPIMLRG